MPPRYVTLATIILDDIVLPDGATRMGTLGGAATHAMAGMRVWSPDVGICAAVGDDLPPEARTTLEAYGADLAGVLTRAAHRTARAWQLFEWDDHRTEIFRSDVADFRSHLQPRLDEIPNAYFASAEGWHIQWGTLQSVRAVALRIRREKPSATICWEPTASQLAEGLDAWSALLPLCDVVSPNLEEASRLCGAADPEAIAETLCRHGAPAVALRMGKVGSLVRRAGDRNLWRVPALPVPVVDVTGAGNAYCGGFTVILTETRDLYEAALHAAVAASFAVEQFGPAPVERLVPEEARERLLRLRDLLSPGANGSAS